MIAELTYADRYELDAFDGDAPPPAAFCDVYEVHAAHVYHAINGRTYSCPGLPADALAEIIARENRPPCEHGLSADLCAGPMHYPDDRYDY